MSGPEILSVIRDDGVASVTLNRPDVHNAFNDRVVADLTHALRTLGENPAVRAVVLRANGKSFSAGADLNWMRRMAGYSYEENLADAQALAGLMRTLDTLAKPTVALVQGPAYGGGVGLVACCDVALASDQASFCLSEVRLGIIPAVIGPYVTAAIGPRAARRYMLTAERFSAVEAHRLGLVHEVVPGHMLDAAGERLIERLKEAGPEAVRDCKDLIRAVAQRPADDAVIRDTAERIARKRATDEAREGMAAFLEKRKPDWTKP